MTRNQFAKLVIDLQGPEQQEVENFASADTSLLLKKVKNIDGIPFGKAKKKQQRSKSPRIKKRGTQIPQGP